MIQPCDCCSGVEKVTPLEIFNRPGLDALAYRVGTYGSFLETMKTHLTTLALIADPKTQELIRPLLALTTRESSDPAIALLDAWAVVAEVLTFYQERLANEGYLRTATERHSILELARLVGYELRPGVAASVYLAFTIENGFVGEIPAGIRVQSIPGPGELPQTYESSEKLSTRAEWNELRPRLSQVQDLGEGTPTIWVKGLTPNLKPNDPILIVDSPTTVHFRQVYALEPEMEKNVTKIFLRGDLDLTGLRTQIDANPPITGKENLPTPAEPQLNASDVPVDQTLKWQAPQAGSPTSYTIQLRVQGDTEWVEKKDHHELNYKPASILNYGTPYEWRVTLSDDKCTEGRPIWHFTTVAENSFTDLKVEQIQATETSWGFSWRWHGDADVAIKIKLWAEKEGEPEDYDDTKQNSYQTETRTDDDKYYWRVIAVKEGKLKGQSERQSFNVADLSESEESGGVSATPGQAVTATTGDQNRLIVANQVIDEIQMKLTELLGNLESAQTAKNKLAAELEIARTPLETVKKLFQLFSEESVAFDFGCYLVWIETTRQTLDSISRQLGLQRGGVSDIPGRIYPNEFADLSESKIQAVKDCLKDPPTDQEGFSQIVLIEIIKLIEGLGGLFEVLRKNDEDEQIKGIKKALYSLEILDFVMTQLKAQNLGDFSTIYKWIGLPTPTPGANNGSISCNLISLIRDLVTDVKSVKTLNNLIPSLLTPPSLQPANALQLDRSVDEIFNEEADITPRLLAALKHPLKDTLYQTWARAKGSVAALSQGVEVLRVKATHFGAASPAKVITGYNPQNGQPTTVDATIGTFIEFIDSANGSNGISKALILDAEYKEIKPGGWVVIEWTKNDFTPPWPEKDKGKSRLTRQIVETSTVSKENQGKLTRLILAEEWTTEQKINKSTSQTDPLFSLRHIVIYAQSEPLELTEEPIEVDVRGKTIHLDRLYQGLEPGRWLIISGERTDIPATTGVRASERVMIAGVRQSIQKIKVEGESEAVPLTDDKIYTTLLLANEGLAYTYKRDSVTIYGNVVKATHGETRTEVLGSGDGSQARQAFTLKQSPLTYLAAPIRRGAESTLEVRVNDIRWREVENLLELGPDERGYITRTDNENNTTLTFGDGMQGTRLSTGVENVRAIYRTGIGQVGNLAAERISLLSSRPLGVKGVINPLPAAGGADRESRDQARRNTPLALLALDRLVSVQDYEDFAHTYAGISKASAVKRSDGRRELIHLTIAGADDIPITPDSDLYRGLFQALQKFGALQLPVQVARRKLKLLVIVANMHLHPDYLWEAVARQIRAVLLETFSFDRRELGQPALLSQALSVMQRAPGVDYVDMDVFAAVSEDDANNPQTLLDKINSEESKISPRIPVKLADFDEEGHIQAAELAYLSPEVPDTLILKEIKG